MVGLFVCQALAAGAGVGATPQASWKAGPSLAVAVFSTDGRFAGAAGIGRGARVWNVANGRTVVSSGEDSSFESIAFSPDARRVAIGTTGRVVIWNVADGRRVRTLPGMAAVVGDMAFSPDGGRLATISGELGRIWDASSGTVLHVLRHRGFLTSVSFSSDGRLVLTSGAAGQLRISSASSGATVRTLRGHAGEVNAAVFSRDDDLVASAGSDGTARIWNAKTGGSLHTLGALGDARMTSVAFSRDDRFIVTGSDSGAIRIWSTATGGLVRTLRARAEGFVNNRAVDATFGPEGGLVLAVNADAARLWDTTTGHALHTLRGSSVGGDAMSAAAFSPDGRLVLTVTMLGKARLWDVATGRIVRDL